MDLKSARANEAKIFCDSSTLTSIQRENFFGSDPSGNSFSCAAAWGQESRDHGEAEGKRSHPFLLEKGYEDGIGAKSLFLDRDLRSSFLISFFDVGRSPYLV
jgi:hypothetical protein